MADPNAKLNSLFGKKKGKKKSTTVNANVIVKTSAQNAERAAAAAAAAAAPPAKPTKPVTTQPTATASGKTLSDLSLNKEEEEEKAAFQWAKQPKKYKNQDDKEGVATTWEEQEQRNRVARRIQLDSERAFPTLGTDSTKVQLQSMKAPTTKAVVTKNKWATLNDEEDDED